MNPGEQFDSLTERYENWYRRHRSEYVSELEAVRSLLPPGGYGLEVGVGTGRFAGPLGIPVGVDPSTNMLRRARRRGVKIIRAVGENLPFNNKTFDYLVMVVTICFVDDPKAVIEESGRVLKSGGRLLIGIVDRESELGHIYLEKQAESPFYRTARFYSVGEIIKYLQSREWEAPVCRQTLFPGADGKTIQESAPGYGEGSFVVISAGRKTRFIN